MGAIKTFYNKIEKEKLRAELLAFRKQFIEKMKEEDKEKIAEFLFSSPEFRSARVIMFYVSTDYEVDTHKMIQRTLLEFKKRVTVPKVEKNKFQLLVSEITKFPDELSKGCYGILEPKRECVRPINLLELDLVIVPGVAFDMRGHRIGYGKGYYDRFLAQLPQKTVTVGLAYSWQVFDKLPITENDIRVKKIITEKGIIECF